ncbi:MAG: ankyrin repeat protein [Planctomycetota bacterium]|jgi:ankyrin repeat protein
MDAIPNLHEFRDALIAGDCATVTRLLDAHPSLLTTEPWQPHWDGAPLDMVARQCTFHRPEAHRLANLLVQRGAPCDLPTAARCGLLDRAQQLLDAHPELGNAIDEQNRTAVYRATCVSGRFDEGLAVTDLLLARGAALDLFSACTLGNVKRVEQLLRADSELARTRDPEGMTALHWAARIRRNPQHAVAITQLLMTHGADVQARNPQEDQMTALHHVAEWGGSIEQADLLLQHGANLNSATRHGLTPLCYAVDRDRKDMIAHLTKLGARQTPPPAT